MSKRIVVGLGILLVLSLPIGPAAAQEDDQGQWTEVPTDSDGAAQATDGTTPSNGEQAEGNGEIASSDEQDGEGAPARRPGGEGLLSGWTLPLLLIGVLVLMYVWMGRSRKKQEQKRKDMLSTLKKGDKIMSIGGILGTVIEARPDELVVKVDEANNVRMRFARWAVRAVGEEAQSEASKDQPQG